MTGEQPTICSDVMYRGTNTAWGLKGEKQGASRRCAVIGQPAAAEASVFWTLNTFIFYLSS